MTLDEFANMVGMEPRGWGRYWHRQKTGAIVQYAPLGDGEVRDLARLLGVSVDEAERVRDRYCMVRLWQASCQAWVEGGWIREIDALAESFRQENSNVGLL